MQTEQSCFYNPLRLSIGTLCHSSWQEIYYNIELAISLQHLTSHVCPIWRCLWIICICYWCVWIIQGILGKRTTPGGLAPAAPPWLCCWARPSRGWAIRLVAGVVSPLPDPPAGQIYSDETSYRRANVRVIPMRIKSKEIKIK